MLILATSMSVTTGKTTKSDRKTAKKRPVDLNPRAESNTSTLCHQLGADKRHRSAPIIESQLTQRADLELVGSSRRQAGQDELAGGGQRKRGRGTGRYAVGHQGITEFVSDCSDQSSNLYGNLSAIGTAIDPLEARTCQGRRRSLGSDNCDETAGIEGCGIV